MRSTRPPVPARILGGAADWQVELSGGESGVAPGQACVFYDGDGAGAQVLGGGIITETICPAMVPQDSEALRAAG